MTRCPDKETLRAALIADESALPDYLIVAACFYQLVEDGAEFSLTEYEIRFSMPGVCDWCAQSLPYEDWKANYYIDIITPNLVDNEAQ